MSENPKITVIIPIYNVERFVKKCIESVLNQTYFNLEVILIDDGSTDNSGDICDYFEKKDKRVRVLHKKNSGVSSARNDGIDISTGKYICFVDGDDYVSEDYVEYLFKLINLNDSDISLSTEWFTSYDLNQKDNKKIKNYTGEMATEAILCYKIPIGVNNKMFLRSFLGKDIRFSEDLCIGEGFNFNTAAFQKTNKIVVGNRRCYFYRKDNENSVTTKFNKEKWEIGLFAIEKIKKDLIIRNETIMKAWDFAWWRTNSDVYDLLVLSNSVNKYPDLYYQCKKVLKKYAFSCFYTKVSYAQKIRAIVMFVNPRLIPLAMQIRQKKHGVDVKH